VPPVLDAPTAIGNLQLMDFEVSIGIQGQLTCAAGTVRRAQSSQFWFVLR
jgi:hypothetical protein